MSVSAPLHPLQNFPSPVPVSLIIPSPHHPSSPLPPPQRHRSRTRVSPVLLSVRSPDCFVRPEDMSPLVLPPMTSRRAPPISTSPHFVVQDSLPEPPLPHLQKVSINISLMRAHDLLSLVSSPQPHQSTPGRHSIHTPGDSSVRHQVLSRISPQHSPPRRMPPPRISLQQHSTPPPHSSPLPRVQT